MQLWLRFVPELAVGIQFHVSHWPVGCWVSPRKHNPRDPVGPVTAASWYPLARLGALTIPPCLLLVSSTRLSHMAFAHFLHTIMLHTSFARVFGRAFRPLRVSRFLRGSFAHVFCLVANDCARRRAEHAHTLTAIRKPHVRMKTNVHTPPV